MRLDRPLPIAVVIPSFHPGGTERQMIELVRRLDPERWAVHLACFRTDGEWYPRAAERASSVASFPIDGFAKRATVSQVRTFARWCRERDIALVHTTDLYSNIFFLPGAALAGVPVRIGSRREIAAGKSLAQLALQRASYACAHHVVANAGAVATRLRAEGVRASMISVIPNGLDLGRFHPRPGGAASRTVAMVANLRPGKGHDTLVDAAALVLSRFPDARFELIGGGTERAALEARAAERGVAHAVAFLGHIEDVPARLAQAAVFTLPSESEAFPNAVLEAMACGLPVVASAVGGIREVVQHGETGFLVSPRDPQALADRICGLFTQPTMATAWGARGRAIVEARYSFDRMVGSFTTLYDQALTRRLPAWAGQSQYASF
ncbi:MAG: glycosyltransferase [Vicinamibacterales bacterium]